MDCPVCKYPNPPGATHCGMCHEVFNRTAAQAYLHAIRRERLAKEGSAPEKEAVILSQRVVEEVRSQKIDWQGLRQQLPTLSFLWKKSRLLVALVACLIAFRLEVSNLFDTGNWYHVLGAKLSYIFPEKVPLQYLVGFKSNVKSWSERQGHLDTPMEHQNSTELGNVLLERKTEKKKAAAKKPAHVMVVAHAREWIQVSNDAAAPVSHAIAKNHPSLADARILLDKKGHVLERRFALSPRVSKSVPFLMPRFPSGRLYRGGQWTEQVEWLDAYSDWQIAWKGTFHWTIGDMGPCMENTCVKLTYTAELSPRLEAVPAWARGTVHKIEATGSGEGEARFDTSHRRLVSNTFSYEGLVRIPIDNLGRIPWELRVGNGVRGPGTIAIRFENKIDLHKN